VTIRFRCNYCSLRLTAEDDRAGRKFECPRCGREGVIPKGQGGQPAGARGAGASDRGQPTAAQRGSDPPTVEPADEEEPVEFRRKRAEDEGIDMTPMVDVTFLLLIFFMVTAAYSLQKSIEVPAPDREESAAQARTVEEIEEDDDYVIIRIGRDNTVWVNEQEAPSEQEVLVKLREAREGQVGTSTHGPSSLLVLADRDARHETVVMCLDAGNAVGMENVRLSCVDEDNL
jgi:biopolymer transport protein ExbD